MSAIDKKKACGGSPSLTRLTPAIFGAVYSPSANSKGGPGETRAEYWDAKVSGLCLRVTPNDVRSWTFRDRRKGSTSFERLALGYYPEISLSAARQRATRRRVEVSDGADLQGEITARREQAARVPTFAQLADEYLERYAKPQKRSWEQDRVRDRVVFISAADMCHLVETSFPDVIRPSLITDTAMAIGCAASNRSDPPSGL